MVGLGFPYFVLFIGLAFALFFFFLGAWASIKDVRVGTVRYTILYDKKKEKVDWEKEGF